MEPLETLLLSSSPRSKAEAAALVSSLTNEQLRQLAKEGDAAEIAAQDHRTHALHAGAPASAPSKAGSAESLLQRRRRRQQLSHAGSNSSDTARPFAEGTASTASATMKTFSSVRRHRRSSGLASKAKALASELEQSERKVEEIAHALAREEAHVERLKSELRQSRANEEQALAMMSAYDESDV